MGFTFDFGEEYGTFELGLDHKRVEKIVLTNGANTAELASVLNNDKVKVFINTRPETNLELIGTELEQFRQFQQWQDEKGFAKEDSALRSGQQPRGGLSPETRDQADTENSENTDNTESTEDAENVESTETKPGLSLNQDNKEEEKEIV